MINWNVIAQLTSLALVLLSGPAIIFLLYFKRGNLQIVTFITSKVVIKILNQRNNFQLVKNFF